MNHILAAVFVTASASLAAQEASHCYTTAQISRLKEQLLQQAKQQQEQQLELLRLYEKSEGEMTAVRACQADKNVLSDLTSILSLEGEKCSREIQEYNFTVVQIQSKARAVELYTSTLNTGLALLKSYVALQCKS